MSSTKELIEQLLPSVNIKLHYGYYKLFYKTMYERMKIWERRNIQKRPFPWTDNPILRDYKYTNVYRELDRSSQWQINNILLKYKELGNVENLIWKLMVYRMFNSWQSFNYLQETYGFVGGIPDYEDYDEEEFLKMLKDVRAAGINPFTNAYLLYSGDGGEINTRDEYYVYKGIRGMRAKFDSGLVDLIQTAETPEQIIEELKQIPTVAAFIAHEYYQDFTYIPIYTDLEVMRFTQNDYTNVGPGASFGIRLIFPSLTKKEQKQAIYTLREEAARMLEKTAVESGEDYVPYVRWNKQSKKYEITDFCNITLHQVEMWLCEFSKYWKMMYKVGKQRSVYKQQL